MTLDDDQLAVLEQCAANVGLELDTTYSGRCMHGARCVALITDRDDERTTFELGMRLAVDLAVGAGELELVELLADKRSCVDSMGLGSVIYWPGVEAHRG